MSYDGRGLVVLSGEDLAVVAPRLDALVQRQVQPPLRPPLGTLGLQDPLVVCNSWCEIMVSPGLLGIFMQFD